MINHNEKLAVLYVAANALSLVAYLPQLYKLLKQPSARVGLSLLTWGWWTVGALIELIYASDAVHDTHWATVAWFHLVACGSAFVLGVVEQSGVLQLLVNWIGVDFAWFGTLVEDDVD